MPIDCPRQIKNTDIFVNTVDNWFGAKKEFDGKGAPAICARLHVGRTAARDMIRDVLVRDSEGNNPTAQVLWYEVGTDESSIRLFNQLNTGKLELMDAELIKGLYLHNVNFARKCDIVQIPTRY